MNAIGGAIWSAAFVGIALSAAAQLLMKVGMARLRAGGHLDGLSLSAVLGVLFDGWVFSGLACYALSAALWLVVLSRMPLSMAYPLISLGIAAVVLLSAVLLGETVSAARILGTALIVLGVGLIGFSR